MKVCTKCKVPQALYQFGKNQLWCKTCKHKNYLANKDLHQLKCKQWVLNNITASKEIKRKSYLNHKERYAEKSKTLYQQNPEHYKSKSNKRFVENRDLILESYRIRYQNLPYSEKRKIALKAKANDKLYPHKANARTALRRARILKATPVWVDKEHRQMISNLYHYAKFMQITTNQIYHVDHIVPLRGKNVCGLHVFNNLRVVTASENLSKTNRLDESLLNNE